MAEATSEDTLLEFPCRFSIKAMGNNTPQLKDTVADLVRPHVAQLDDSQISTRVSAKGNYLSVNVVFTATSKAQLDSIYRALSSHPDIKMAL
ncbi:MAG: hypothetical protein RLZZ502_1845 [Pseudomonadota bacterium]|jgi:putative lipoic acid-binding regulatory protein